MYQKKINQPINKLNPRSANYDRIYVNIRAKEAVEITELARKYETSKGALCRILIAYSLENLIKKDSDRKNFEGYIEKDRKILSEVKRNAQLKLTQKRIAITIDKEKLNNLKKGVDLIYSHISETNNNVDEVIASYYSKYAIDVIKKIRKNELEYSIIEVLTWNDLFYKLHRLYSFEGGLKKDYYIEITDVDYKKKGNGLSLHFKDLEIDNIRLFTIKNNLSLIKTVKAIVKIVNDKMNDPDFIKLLKKELMK